MANLIRLTGLEGLAALEDRMNRLVEEVFGGEPALGRGTALRAQPVGKFPIHRDQA